MANIGRINRDHQARLISHDGNQLTNLSNEKLDTALVQQTAVNTKLDSYAGAANNNIGVAASKLQVFPYAKDAGNSIMRPLTCDANGRLECSVDALEVSMAQVNLNTDTLEAKMQATTDKLDSFAGAGNNTVGEGQSKLQVFNYGKDGSTYRPMVVDSSGHLQVDVLSTALPSGSATEATLAAAEVHLGAIQTAVQLIDNTVATSGSGAASDKLQQVGGKFLDGTSRHIRTDTLGRVEVDIHTGGVIDTRLGALVTDAAATEVLITATNGLLTTLDGVQDNVLSKLGEIETSADALIAANHTDLVALEASLTSMEGKMDVDNVVYDNQLTKLTNIETAVQILDNVVSGNEIQCDVLTMPTVAITHSALTELAGAINLDKLDVVVTNSPVLGAGSAAIGKLAANSGVDIGDVDVTSLPLTFNSGNKGASTQRVVIATDDIPIALVNTKLDHLSANQDTLEASLTSMEGKQDDMVTALQILDNCISGSEAQVDVITMPTVAITHSALTELAGAINLDKLDVVVTNSPVLGAGSAAIGKLSANSGVDIGDVDVTSLPLTFNSGNKGATTQRVVIATDDIPIALVNTKLEAGNVLLGTIDSDTDAIKTSTAAIATDIAANEVLHTAANALLTTIDADTDAIKTSAAAIATDVAANEVLHTAANALLTTIDSDTDAIKTSTAAIATDIAANEVLITAGNALLTTIDADTNDIKTSTAAIATDAAANEVLLTSILAKQVVLSSCEDKEVIDNDSISANGLSIAIDTEFFKEFRLYGNTTAATGSNLTLWGSNETGGTYYQLMNADFQAQTVAVSGSDVHYIGLFQQTTPRFVKVYNKNLGSAYTVTKLRLVGFNKHAEQ